MLYWTVRQGVESRSDAFDGFYQILTVDDVTKKIDQTQTAALWLNIQVDGICIFNSHHLVFFMF